MDSKYEAIDMVRQMDLLTLNNKTYNKVNGSIKMPNNPLTDVLYEILNTEIVIPSLQFVEDELGETNISFNRFKKSKKKDSIQLEFSIPSITLESNIGNKSIAKEVVNTYLKEGKRFVN